jgi:hypothetical protein
VAVIYTPLLIAFIVIALGLAELQGPHHWGTREESAELAARKANGGRATSAPAERRRHAPWRSSAHGTAICNFYYDYNLISTF